MVATSGAQLLPNAAITNLSAHILPITTVLTPNIPEARLLLEKAGFNVPELNSLSDIVAIAKLVQGLGPKYVLVKGGHLPLGKDDKIATQDTDKSVVVDVLHDGQECTVMRTDYSPSKNTHGTGCSLACKLSLSHLPPKTNLPKPLCHCMCYIVSLSIISISAFRLRHTHSGDSIEPRSWKRDGRSGQASGAIRRNRHQNKRRPRSWQRSYQPLPFDIQVGGSSTYFVASLGEMVDT